jgi:iron(III) transport system substrate-binding protein
LLVAAVLAALAAVLVACGTPAATPTPRPQATPTAAAGVTPTPVDSAFEQEWAALEAAARAEGELVILGGGAASRAFGEPFKVFGDKYGIEIVFSAGSASAQVDRLLAERQANRYEADVAFFGPTTARQRAIPNGLLDPIMDYLFHPEALDLSQWYGNRFWYADPEETYVLVHSATVDPAPVTIQRNTNLVGPDEIQSVWDLLDDKWKGEKIVSLPLDDAGAGGTWFAAYAHPDIGPEWIERYLTEMDVFFTNEARVISDGLANGRFHLAVAIGAVARDIDVMEEQRLPVTRVTQLRETPVLSGSGSSNTLAMINRAKHPNAAKLFVNWFLTREGQTAVHERAEVIPDPSLRNDVPPGKTNPDESRQPGMEYIFISSDPQFTALDEEATAFARDLYRQIRR